MPLSLDLKPYPARTTGSMTYLSKRRRRIIALTTLLAAAFVIGACTSSNSEEPTSAPATATRSPSEAAAATADPAPATRPDATSQAAASPATQSPAASNRIAVVSTNGVVYLIDPDGSNRWQLTSSNPALLGGVLGEFFSWPSWSPDSRHLLITAFTPDVDGGLETSLLRTSATPANAAPELIYRDVPGTNGIGSGVPHFPLWHPDGDSVVLIANIGEGLATFVVDVESGPGASVSNGAPVYVDWSADGSKMLVHTAERLVLHEFAADGSRESSEAIGNGSISYRVPLFSPVSDDFIYVDAFGGGRQILRGSAASLDEPMPLLEAQASNGFAWSPDGSRIAFGTGTRNGIFDRLLVADATGGDARTLVEDFVAAFWWSPDGKKLLTVGINEDPGQAVLSVVDVDTGAVEEIAVVEPTFEMSFISAFFDQYAANLRLWSPDSNSVLFSGLLVSDTSTGVRVQSGDEVPSVWLFDVSGSSLPPISLGAGVMATWSPQ